MSVNIKEVAETVLNIERANNERWNQGDCYGYLDSYSDDISYFDPVTEKLQKCWNTTEVFMLN